MDILGTEKLMDELDGIDVDYYKDANTSRMVCRYVLAYGKYCLKCIALGLTLGTVTQVLSEFIRSRFNK